METLDGDYPADAVILATGAARAVPRIPGLAGLEGHGVSYCATCDAFFYRGRDVAVVGSGEYALHEEMCIRDRVDGRPVAAGNARLMKKLGLSVPDVPQTGTIVHVAIDGRYAGYLLIADVVKPHSAQAIRGLMQAGVRKTVMLTGDAEPVAKAVSAELGLDEYHAGLLPGDKVDQIEKLIAEKRPKENLAFVGDGINDAPVLSRADIGIAMGALGSDAAIEAADVVLMDDDPLKISRAIKISRKCIRIVYENIVFALGVKFAFLLLGCLLYTSRCV